MAVPLSKSATSLRRFVTRLATHRRSCAKKSPKKSSFLRDRVEISGSRLRLTAELMHVSALKEGGLPPVVPHTESLAALYRGFIDRVWLGPYCFQALLGSPQQACYRVPYKSGTDSATASNKPRLPVADPYRTLECLSRGSQIFFHTADAE